MSLHIGTADWSLPKQHTALFCNEGSHLERYASRLRCVEVNSSFYRPHRRSTWERWAASTPEEFRFAVKVPKAITHAAKLQNCGAALQAFLTEVTGLGEKLGPLLVQLPPSLAFEEGTAREFFTTLRELYPSNVALEPRHESWFTPPVSRLLQEFEIARVAADPPKGSSIAGQPGGWQGLRYHRLHGAPRTYYSEYSAEFLKEFAAGLDAVPGSQTWVIFDNTALGHAAENAIRLMDLASAIVWKR